MPLPRPRLLFPGLLVAALAVGASFVDGQESGGSPAHLPADTFRLDNGLGVVVAEDRSGPVVAVSLWVHAGGAREGEGERGLARILFGMLSGGGEGVGSDEVGRSLARAGGVRDGAVGLDRTAFVETLPSHRLDLALRLQAARLQERSFAAADVERWRLVAAEEARLALDMRAGGRGVAVLDSLVGGSGPYIRGPGSLGRPDPVTADAVAGFHRRFFVPRNAVLAVVGDVSTAELRGAVERHFGGLGGGEPAPDLGGFPDVSSGSRPDPESPGATAGRRLELDDPALRAPLVWTAYALPPARHPDRHALDAAVAILGGGAGTRLRDRLVHVEGLAGEVVAQTEWRVGPGIVRFGVASRPDGEPEAIEAALADGVARLGRDGPSALELEGALRRLRVERASRRASVPGRADELQRQVLHQGLAAASGDAGSAWEAVTAGDVRRVVRTWLTPENRAVVVVRPAGGPPAGGAGATGAGGGG